MFIDKEGYFDCKVLAKVFLFLLLSSLSSSFSLLPRSRREYARLAFFSATPNAIATAEYKYTAVYCRVYTLLSSYGAHYSTYAAFAVVASDALEARAIKAAKVQL